MAKLIDYNANYWGQTNGRDCGIRAISQATQYGYIYLAKYFGKDIDTKTGIKVSGAITVPNIEKFSSEHSKVLKKIFIDHEFFRFISGKNSLYTPSKLTVEKFVNENKGKCILYTYPTMWELNPDNFNSLSTLMNNLKDKNKGKLRSYPPHALFVDCDKKEVYDIVNSDAPNQLKYLKVLIAWKVDEHKILTNDNNSRTSEIKKYNL